MQHRFAFAAGLLSFSAILAFSAKTGIITIGEVECFLKEHMENGRLSFDGIFCNTDQLTWEVQKILTRLELRTPEDVQPIGFDGIRKFGVKDLYCSTIVQPVEKIAETCVNIVLSPNHSDIPALVCLPVSYVSSDTTREEIPLLR